MSNQRIETIQLDVISEKNLLVRNVDVCTNDVFIGSNKKTSVSNIF